MQFRVVRGPGNTVVLHPISLDKDATSFTLNGDQKPILPLFLECAGALFAVTSYEEERYSSLGSGVGGPEKSHVYEWEEPLRLKQFLIGRLALEWENVPVAGHVFWWPEGDQQSKQSQSKSIIGLDHLLREVHKKSGAGSSIMLSFGSPLTLEELEAAVKSVEFINSQDWVVEAVVRLGVQQAELAEFASSVLALILNTMGDMSRFLSKLDETLQTLTNVYAEATEKFELAKAAILYSRTRGAALAYWINQWQEGQPAIRNTDVG